MWSVRLDRLVTADQGTRNWLRRQPTPHTALLSDNKYVVSETGRAGDRRPGDKELGTTPAHTTQDSSLSDNKYVVSETGQAGDRWPGDKELGTTPAHTTHGSSQWQ